MSKEVIGFTTGVFDLFHVGHLNLLEACKEHCDHLIVAVCGDDYVRDVKHKEPVFPEEDRIRILSSLRCVDEVVKISIEEVEDKVLAWNHYHFDILFSGDDWQGSDRYLRTEEQFKELGAEIVYLPYTVGVSTTEIKKILDTHDCAD